MSRKKRHPPTNGKPLAEPIAEAAPEEVAVHRRCPLCYPNRGGTGLAYGTRGRTRYYKCQVCTHTWTATVVTEVVRIEHRVVNLATREKN